MRLQIILRSWIIRPIGLISCLHKWTLCLSLRNYHEHSHSFEKNGQLVPLHGIDVHYPISQDDHIQWLCISIHHRRIFPSTVEWSLQFSHLVSINFVSKANRNKAEYTLKLTCCELNDYNIDEHIKECIEWCQKFLKLGGSMVDVVFVDEVGFILHLTHWFGRACQGQRCQWICPTQRGQNSSLVVTIGCKSCDRVVAYNVTLGGYNTNKFL